MTQPTKDMGVDPISLDTMDIADTLPEYHCGDNGLLERNLYSSDTKNERISISPSIFSSEDSVSNSHFPGTKSLLFTSKLLPSLLNYSIEPTSAERGLQDYFQVDQPIVIKWLHSGSTKSRPTGHRRGRPPRTSDEPSGHKILLSLHRRRRRGCPPRSVLFYYRGGIDRRDLGVADLRTIITVLRQTQAQFFSLLDVLIFDAFCMSYCYRIMMPIHNPSYTPFLFKGGRGRQSSTYHSAIFVSGIQVCLLLAILI